VTFSLPPVPTLNLTGRVLSLNITVPEELLMDAPFPLSDYLQADFRMLFGDPSAPLPRGLISIPDDAVRATTAVEPVLGPPATPPARPRRNGRRPDWLDAEERRAQRRRSRGR
jgi:hypothetical protein